MQIKETGSKELKKQYSVTVPAKDINGAMDKELKALSGKVKIPGFRPGNVPLKVMKSRYGKNVEADVLKNVVNEATQKVITDNKLRIAMTPDVQVKDYKEDGELVFDLTVETLPEMPEIDFSKVTIEKETFEVADSEIEEALKSMSERNPTQVALEDSKKAEKGHVLKVDFVGKVDGVAFEGGTAEDFDIEIGSGRLIDDFEEQLIGAKAGDAKTVKVTFPENYFNKELANKKAEFDVTVKQVFEQVPAEINEEFAKQKGFADLRSLKEGLRDQIVKDYDSIVRARVKKRLFDALEDQCDYPLPPTMLESEFKSIWGQIEQAKEQGQGDEIFEGRKEADVKKEYQQIAERRVRLGILLAEIGAKENIQVGREELTQALMNHASQFPGQEQAVFDFYRKNPQRLDELRGPILEEKAVDWVMSKVKTTEKKVDTKTLREQADEDESGSTAEKPKAKKSTKKKATKSKKSDEGDNE